MKKILSAILAFLMQLFGLATPEVSMQQVDVFPTWTMLCPSRKFGRMLRQYDLDAGRHTLRFKVEKNAFDIEAVAVTDSPGSFERR